MLIKLKSTESLGPAYQGLQDGTILQTVPCPGGLRHLDSPGVAWAKVPPNGNVMRFDPHDYEEYTVPAGGGGKTILAIDPGETTGWALLLDDGKLLAYGAVHTPDSSGLALLVAMLPSADFVVLESAPINGKADQAARVQRLEEFVLASDREYGLLEYVSPGTWKPAMRQHRAIVPKTTAVHYKDALNMGMWWLVFGGGRDE